jgi:hypothetical protein
MPHALDHRGMVQRVGEDDAARQQPPERRQRRDIGEIAGIEQERRALAMELGELRLELDMEMLSARNVAGAAGAGADCVQGLVHRPDHQRMLPHGKVVVGTPHRYVALALRRHQPRLRKGAAQPLQIGELAIPTLRPELGKGTAEDVVMHRHGRQRQCYGALPSRNRVNCRRLGRQAASRRKGWHMQWTPPPAQVNMVMSGS